MIRRVRVPRGNNSFVALLVVVLLLYVASPNQLVGLLVVLTAISFVIAKVVVDPCIEWNKRVDKAVEKREGWYDLDDKTLRKYVKRKMAGMRCPEFDRIIEKELEYWTQEYTEIWSILKKEWKDVDDQTLIASMSYEDYGYARLRRITSYHVFHDDYTETVYADIDEGLNKILVTEYSKAFHMASHCRVDLEQKWIG